MKKIFYLVFIFTLFSCGKDKIENPDCEKLQAGLTELNETLVKNEIEKLTIDLHPQPTSEDLIGHMANIKALADRISEKCNQLTTEVVCYTCSYDTYPATSEISVEFDYEGQTHLVYIYIFTPANDILRFGGLDVQ